jgi:ATP-dependent DNA helicase Q1
MLLAHFLFKKQWIELFLYNVMARFLFSQSKSCRRGAFFRHFGEALQDCNGIFMILYFSGAKHLAINIYKISFAGMCDNCASSIELKDIDATCMIIFP